MAPSCVLHCVDLLWPLIILLIIVPQTDASFDPWLQEYAHGTGQEIYRTILSSELHGLNFVQAAQKLYKKFSITMFGIEVERLGDALRDDNTPENERIVLLNPVSYT